MTAQDRDGFLLSIPRGLRGTLTVITGAVIPAAVIGLPLFWYLSTWPVTP